MGRDDATVERELASFCTPDIGGQEWEADLVARCEDDAVGAHLVAAGVTPSELDIPADSSMPVTEVSA